MCDWRRGAFLPIVLMSVCGLSGCGGRSHEWPYTVEMGGTRLNVEVAVTPEQKDRGLMFRDRLDENWGMLFVYDTEQPLSFWMKNTRMPLSIAFVDRARIVRDIRDMPPLSEETHTSKVPAMYALEVNQGWFRRHKVTPGTDVTFSTELDDLIAETRQEN